MVDKKSEKKPVETSGAAKPKAVVKPPSKAYIALTAGSSRMTVIRELVSPFGVHVTVRTQKEGVKYPGYRTSQKKDFPNAQQAELFVVEITKKAEANGWKVTQKAQATAPLSFEEIVRKA